MIRNWEQHAVTDRELENFERFGTPITLPFGVVPPNGGITLVNESGKKVSAIFDAQMKAVRPLTRDNPRSGMRPANKDLHLLYDHLQNDDLPIVIADGYFGVGKTSTVMAHAVARMKMDSAFKLVLSKPHVSLGKSYGALPGDMHDKTDLEFQSFYQYIERYHHLTVEQLKAFGQLEIAPLEYIRGRDYPNAWVVVDESQNLTEEEAITFASRVADGSKLIMLGDTSPWQKDHRGKSGLLSFIELMEHEGIVGITEFKTQQHVLRGVVAKALIGALLRREASK